jgi:hypothetical protein
VRRDAVGDRGDVELRDGLVGDDVPEVALRVGDRVRDRLALPLEDDGNRKGACKVDHTHGMARSFTITPCSGERGVVFTLTFLIGNFLVAYAGMQSIERLEE